MSMGQILFPACLRICLLMIANDLVFVSVIFLELL